MRLRWVTALSVIWGAMPVVHVLRYFVGVATPAEMSFFEETISVAITAAPDLVLITICGWLLKGHPRFYRVVMIMLLPLMAMSINLLHRLPWVYLAPLVAVQLVPLAVHRVICWNYGWRGGLIGSLSYLSWFGWVVWYVIYDDEIPD